MSALMVILAQAAETPPENSGLGTLIFLAGLGWLIWACFRPRGWTVSGRSEYHVRPK